MTGWPKLYPISSSLVLPMPAVGREFPQQDGGGGVCDIQGIVAATTAVQTCHQNGFPYGIDWIGAIGSAYIGSDRAAIDEIAGAGWSSSGRPVSTYSVSPCWARKPSVRCPVSRCEGVHHAVVGTHVHRTGTTGLCGFVVAVAGIGIVEHRAADKGRLGFQRIAQHGFTVAIQPVG